MQGVFFGKHNGGQAGALQMQECKETQSYLQNISGSHPSWANNILTKIMIFLKNVCLVQSQNTDKKL